MQITSQSSTQASTQAVRQNMPSDGVDNMRDNDARNEKITRLLNRYNKAKTRRNNWNALWQEAYDFTLPNRGQFAQSITPGRANNEQIFDATAMDAVDQLAASILGNLTPPWSQWFGLKPGRDLSPAESEALAPVLEEAGKILQDHLDRSNFAVEIHQSFLDLIIGGTASLYFDEADPGGFSAFKFTSVPLSQIVLEEGGSGLLDGTFRHSTATLAQILERFPSSQNKIPDNITRRADRDPQEEFPILESVTPVFNGYEYDALLLDNGSGTSSGGNEFYHDFAAGFAGAISGDNVITLENRILTHNPFINFRWVKTPDEIYGRSPVMKALPDIKTANKVVELVLKNASIAVTGIWQAEDDGVLNPSNIRLVPGEIIPKAMGSRGLTPLEIPGRFDVSELVLEDLRSRIRHALLADRLTQINARTMTATEVLERSAEMALVLGATYGRMQTELLIPLVTRAFNILRRRGEVPDIDLDGRLVQIDFRSPLARSQGQRDTQNTISWINTVLSLGPQAQEAVDLPRIARFLGEALGVPSDLIREELPPAPAPSNVPPNVPLNAPLNTLPGALPAQPETQTQVQTKQEE